MEDSFDDIDDEMENPDRFEIDEEIEDDLESGQRLEIRKKIRSTLHNKTSMIQGKGGFKDDRLKSYPRNERGIVIAKPFDYEDLRRREARRGVIFLQHTTRMLDNRKQVKDFFSREAKVLRVEPKIQMKGNKEKLEGFYVEFSTNDIARRIVRDFHHKPFSRKISSVLTLKVIENFRWSDYYDQNDRKKLIRKFIMLNTEKELKEIQEYRSNVKKSKRIVKNNEKMKRIHHKQKKAKVFNIKQTSHLSKMNFFQ